MKKTRATMIVMTDTVETIAIRYFWFFSFELSSSSSFSSSSSSSSFESSGFDNKVS